jgi:Right handed beta helix region
MILSKALIYKLFICVLAFFAFVAHAGDIKINDKYSTHDRKLWWETLITGASIDESKIQHTIYVDKLHHKASDANSGTRAKPFKSISAALLKAKKFMLANKSIKVSIAPGVYRETFELSGTGDNRGIVLIEGQQAGKVIISGSKVWKFWKKEGNSEIYVAKWPHKWGLAPYPFLGTHSWKKFLNLKDIVRRREMVFVNGKRLRQVLTPQELRAGSFYVDEKLALLKVWPPQGTDLKSATVKVGELKGLASFNNLNNLVVRNLVFEHDTTPCEGCAVKVELVNNVLFEKVLARFNNWNGITFIKCSKVSFKNVVCNHNGGAGVDTWYGNNVIWEDCEYSYNNWRGARGEFYGWSVGGSKQLHTKGGIFRNIKTVHNQTHGFWLDYDSENIVMDNLHVVNNRDGIFLEANQGPIVLRKSLVAFNHTVGVSSTNSRNVVLENNIIYGNKDSQIMIFGKAERRVLSGRKRPISYWMRCESWSLYCNVIASDKPSKLLEIVGWPWFLKSAWGGKNLYYCPGDERNGFKLSSSNVTLKQWQDITESDRSSIFAKPGFTDPAKLDFTLKAQSTLRKRTKWPTRTPPGNGLKIYNEIVKKDVKSSWHDNYPIAQKAKPGQWQKLNLDAYANLSLTQKFVLGGLKHLPPGEHKIQGVPYQVIDESSNNGKGVVALKSKNNMRQKLSDAPAELSIPINQKVIAVYVLHGAGWCAWKHEKIGQYSLVYEDGTESAVDLVAFGKGSEHRAVFEQLARDSNIADWYPTIGTKLNNPNAKLALIVDPKKPAAYHRYIYTLQLINPSPEKMVKALKLVSEPSKEPALLIIGATALKVNEDI